MSGLNLEKILAERPSGRFSPAVAEARRKEQGYRSGSAQSRAQKALTYLYPHEYRELYLQAQAKLNAERGPLPGDEAAS